MRRIHLLASAILALCAATAVAQDYPNRPIRFIVPTTPGNTTDLLGRIVATETSKILGQPVIVENRTGANQLIGIEFVAKQAAADGHTAAVIGIEGLVLLPLTSRNIRFDPFKDIVPVAGLAEGRYFLASSATLPWKTFNEFIAHAKANPGKLNYGSSVVQVRLPVLMIMQTHGLDLVHIPYTGGAPYLQALLAGEVQLGIGGEGPLTGMGERIRILAVTGDQRLPAFRDSPTFAELGFSQIRGPSYMLSVRAGTSREIIDRLNAAVSRALQTTEAKTSLAKILLTATNTPPALTSKTITEQARFYADLARSIGITPK